MLHLSYINRCCGGSGAVGILLELLSEGDSVPVGELNKSFVVNINATGSPVISGAASPSFNLDLEAKNFTAEIFANLDSQANTTIQGDSINPIELLLFASEGIGADLSHSLSLDLLALAKSPVVANLSHGLQLDLSSEIELVDNSGLDASMGMVQLSAAGVNKNVSGTDAVYIGMLEASSSATLLINSDANVTIQVELEAHSVDTSTGSGSGTISLELNSDGGFSDAFDDKC